MSRGLAEPGELVVCINDRFPPQIDEWMTAAPVAGEVYTVVEAWIYPDAITGIRGPAYVLAEFEGRGVGGGKACAFSVFRFRRLEYEETNEDEGELVGIGCGDGDVRWS